MREEPLIALSPRIKLDKKLSPTKMNTTYNLETNHDEFIKDDYFLDLGRYHGHQAFVYDNIIRLGLHFLESPNESATMIVQQKYQMVLIIRECINR